MQSIIPTETADYLDAGLAPVLRADGLSSRRTEAWRQRLVNLTLISSDVVLALVLWEVACLIRILWPSGYLPGFMSSAPLSGTMIMGIVPIVLVWLGLRATQGLYPGYGMDDTEELRRHVYALLATLAFTATFALAFQIGDNLSRFLLALVFMSLLFLSPLVRYAIKGWLRRHGVWGKPVIILGTGNAGVQLKELLNQEWRLGFRPAAFFDSRREGRITEIDKGRFGENVLEQAVRSGYEHRIDTLCLAMPHTSRQYMARLADSTTVHFRSVVIIPDLAAVTNAATVARNLAGALNLVGTLGLEVRHNHLLNPWVCRFKRGLDLLGALAGGLLISPVLVGLAILIKLSSPGPVFFAHRRLGAGNTHFRCWKFRTMHTDAQQLLEKHLENNPHLRAEWEQNYKLSDDPRVTRVGRFLRKTSLDELPQLWNVLRGEMSLVGPRPIVDEEATKYGENYALYRRVQPGMSGLWQISGRSDMSYEQRVAIDAHYVRNWSVWLDLVILARTVRCVFARCGAY